ncbi:hypothetical protein O181_013598 [Austropuccinia psidii MF-1]|uniref:6,7-dimethyl-8-ribityllumazine synthase n=1 Tax=Austropuccinia psidii MF-1 TaxID=1389203 RepID=A0A9Q3BYZ9_9BASI|nr:hypothetical protein [Austropuccinia psidii MF-1]
MKSNHLGSWGSFGNGGLHVACTCKKCVPSTLLSACWLFSVGDKTSETQLEPTSFARSNARMKDNQHQGLEYAFLNQLPTSKPLQDLCKSLRILIVHTRWNQPIIDSLVQTAIETLTSSPINLQRQNVLIESVVGSYELPWMCNAVLSNSDFHKNIDAIISIGVLIKGETMHFEYIADSVSTNLTKVSIDHNKPIIFGVLTCLNQDQALERAGLGSSPNSESLAIGWAKTAVDCAIKGRWSPTSFARQYTLMTPKDSS